MSKPISVRGHSRKSKTGRLGLVKPYVRTLKGSSIALGKRSKAEAEILSIKDELEGHKKQFSEAVKSGDIKKQQEITKRVEHLAKRFERWMDAHAKTIGLSSLAIAMAVGVSSGLGMILLPLAGFHLASAATIGLLSSGEKRRVKEGAFKRKARKKRQFEERKIFG